MQTLKVLFIIQSANTIWLRSCRNICFKSQATAIHVPGAAVTHPVISASLTFPQSPSTPSHKPLSVQCFKLKGHHKTGWLSEPWSWGSAWCGQDTCGRLQGDWWVPPLNIGLESSTVFMGKMSQVDCSSQQGFQSVVNLLWGSEPATPQTTCPGGVQVSKCTGWPTSAPQSLPPNCSSTCLSRASGLLRVKRDSRNSWLRRIRALLGILYHTPSLCAGWWWQSGQCLSLSCSQPRCRGLTLSCQRPSW